MRVRTLLHFSIKSSLHSPTCLSRLCSRLPQVTLVVLYGAASSVAMVLLVRANVGVEVSSMPALARAHVGTIGERVVNGVLFLELFLASVTVQVSPTTTTIAMIQACK